MSRPTHQWDTSGIKHMKIEEEATIPATNFPTVIDYQEAERYIEEFKKFELKEVGNSQWMEQHRRLERLNLQAHQNAMSNSDEYIMEGFLTHDKMSTLLHDLISTEAWKENIFPLLKDELAGRNSMRLYFMLYHEATIVNILEVFFYYRHVLESLGDKLLDIVDYIARKLIRLQQLGNKFRTVDLNPTSTPTTTTTTVEEAASASAKKWVETLEKKTPVEELEGHWLDIEFRICVTAVSLARFLTEHAEYLPLSVLSRISDVHDYLMLLIPLIENPPWTRRVERSQSNNNQQAGGFQWQKLIDLKWKVILPIDLLKVTKLEGQSWIAFYHLIAQKVFSERYTMHSYRKGQILRLRKYMNELLLDQLPFLADVQRYLDELTVMNVPEVANAQASSSSLLSGVGNETAFLFQPVAMLTDAIIRNQKFPEVAEYQKMNVFTMTDQNDRDILKMAEVYTDDAVEQILDPDAFNNNTESI
jgi:zinc finger MYND domain-containing protein 10